MSTSEPANLGISLRIYSAFLHRSHAAHFPLKSPYLSSQRLVLLQLAIEVRSLCLHSYFISNSNIYLCKSDIISSRWHPWWELDALTFQWQVNCWRADRRHQRHVSRLHHPVIPLLRLLLCSLRRPNFFFAHADFFPFSPNEEPGPRLYTFRQEKDV